MGFFCVKKINELVVASSFHSNALVFFNDDFSINSVQVFEDILEKQYLHRQIIRHKDYLYFTPFIGNSIVRYDIRFNTKRTFFISSGDEYFFADAKLYKNNIYLFPRILKYGLWYFDTDLNSFTEDESFSESLKKVGLKEEQRFDTFSVDIDDGILYFVAVGKCYIFRYDIQSKTLDYIKIKDASLRNLLLDNNNIWLTSLEKCCVYCVDKRNGEFIEYEKESLNDYYHRVVKCGARIMLLPVEGYNIEEIIDGKIVSPFDIRDNGNVDETVDSFAEPYVLDDKIVFLPLMDKKIKVINLEDNSINLVDFNVDEIADRKKYLSLFSKQEIYESAEYGLVALIEGVKNYGQ